MRQALAGARATSLVVAVLGLLWAVGACESAPRQPSAQPAHAVPFAGCAGLTGPGADGATTPVGSAALPDLVLPCYAGGSDVDLTAVRGPAVINLWASWCAPCRAELPVLQAFADRHAGQVRVIGVVSMDERDAAVGLADDLAVRFPQLDDREGRLMRAVERTALPITVFVDRAGRVSELYNGRALDRRTLDELAERHLGLVPA
jgi:thiol-disulfide isomerase/thioredoxin